MEVSLLQPTTRNTKLTCVEFIDNGGNWLELYFSYQTIVAFRTGGHKMVVAQNIWSNTTGRHLNEIDGGRKEDRVNPNTFQKQLNEALERFFDA